MAVGEWPLGLVPDCVAFAGQAPAGEITVGRHWRGPALDAQGAILLQRASVVRDEIDKLPRFVEHQFRRDRFGTKGEGHFSARIVDSGPGQARVGQGGKVQRSKGRSKS